MTKRFGKLAFIIRDGQLMIKSVKTLRFPPKPAPPPVALPRYGTPGSVLCGKPKGQLERDYLNLLVNPVFDSLTSIDPWETPTSYRQPRQPLPPYLGSIPGYLVHRYADDLLSGKLKIEDLKEILKTQTGMGDAILGRPSSVACTAGSLLWPQPSNGTSTPSEICGGQSLPLTDGLTLEVTQPHTQSLSGGLST